MHGKVSNYYRHRGGSLPDEVIVRLKEEQMLSDQLLHKIKDEELRKKKIADQHKQYFNNFDKMLYKYLHRYIRFLTIQTKRM